MSTLFGGSKTTTAEVKSPATMPDDNSPSVLEAKRRRELEVLSRGGRKSTILTDSSGGDYSGTTLGAS